MGTHQGRAGRTRAVALVACVSVGLMPAAARADDPPDVPPRQLLAFPTEPPPLYAPTTSPVPLPPLAPLPPTVLSPQKPKPSILPHLELGPPQPPPGAANTAALLKKDDKEGDYTTRRYEPAGFPLLGGDSDIGFQFGAVATLSRFENGIRPYAWNMDFVASTSVKDGPTGVSFVQQSFLWHDDIVGLWEGKLRLNPQVSYSRTVNEGYFGLGNASSGVVPGNFVGAAGRYFQWIDSIATARIVPRLAIKGPWFATGMLSYRYMDPSAYADSKLARDAVARNPDGTPLIRGLRPLSIPALSLGLGYDTRDDEIFPRHGAYNQMGIEYLQGAPTSADVEYGEAELQVSGFRSVGPFVFAGRFTADFQFGHVPFYDLLEYGVFGQFEAIGGEAGVRGVPVGRYLGEIKMYGNAEVRTMFWKFSLFRQKFGMGADVLLDAGRSWLDYSFRSPYDGSGLGLKYGVGGGIYALWGQAALFRIDIAYSPDAAAENPHFPVGLYVADGTNF